MNFDPQRINETLTSKEWQWIFDDQNSDAIRLQSLLIEKLPHIDPDSWPTRFWLGGVFVNGIMVLEDRTLRAPCKIEYYEPKYDINKLENQFPVFHESWIVYQDQDLAIIYKPAALPSLPNKEQRHFNLRGYVEEHFGHRVHMPSRLDTSTSGLVAISLSQRMHAQLQQAFEFRRVSKYYMLKISEPVEWSEITIDAPIGRDRRHPILRKVDFEAGKSARTHFQFLGQDQQGSVLLAQPFSGRTHQIRVHSAEHFGPILGDNFYGGRAAPGLHLLSVAFKLLHPFQETELCITAPESLVPDWAKPFVNSLNI